MPRRPREVERLVRLLSGLFQQADKNLGQGAAEIERDVDLFRSESRLRRALAGFTRTVNVSMQTLQVESRGWWGSSFPRIYEMGGRSASTQFQWSMFNRATSSRLADEGHRRLVNATNFTNRDTKRWARDMLRQQARFQLQGGTSRADAVRRIDRLGEIRGIRGIRYSNGAFHSLSDYSDMVLRTITGQAYNLSAVLQTGAEGGTHVEVFDGPECGWTSHDDGDLANGTIRTVEEAAIFLLAHPNCQRGFSPVGTSQDSSLDVSDLLERSLDSIFPG